MKGITKSGFRYRLDKEKLNDWEILEMFADLDNNDVTKMVPLAKKLLGMNQYNALKKHCRNDKGIVQADKMNQEIIEIFDTKPVKT